MALKIITAVALTASLTLTGCATNQGTQEQAGMVIGGILGGVLGNQIGDGSGRTAAIIAGTLIGASIGGALGESMDASDREHVSESLETVRTGVPSRWRNPDTGNEFTVVPTKTFETSSGPCREYTIDAVIDGRDEKVNGTACRQPEGSWRVQG